MLGLLKKSSALEPKRVARHAAAAVDAAVIHPAPAPYIFVENVFPADFYPLILQHFAATAPLFKAKVHPVDAARYHGSYAERTEIDIERIDESAPSAAFWRYLFRELKSPLFFAALLEKFRPGLEARFGAGAVTPDLRRTLGSSMTLTHHRPGFHVGPHTDIGHRVVTCIFNCAERPGLDHLGTAIYVPKQKGLTSDGSAHLRPDLFERIHVSPYRPNSALIFLRNDALFHGVERLTTENLQASNRPNILFNLLEKAAGPAVHR